MEDFIVSRWNDIYSAWSHLFIGKVQLTDVIWMIVSVILLFIIYKILRTLLSFLRWLVLPSKKKEGI